MIYLTLFLTILVPILTLFAKGKWKDTNWAARTLLIIAVLTAGAGAYASFKQWKKDELIEKIESRFGQIDDLYGATFPKIVFGPDNNAVVDWFVLVRTWQDLINFTAPFRLYIKGGKLYIDIVVRDKNGKPIAVIDGNEWTVYDSDFEYNNDETGFEMVTKGDRKVYFQVHLEKGIAHILGIILNEDGKGFCFYEPAVSDPTVKVDSTHYKVNIPMIALGPGADDKYYRGVKGRIFKYPRQKYLGVRQ